MPVIVGTDHISDDQAQLLARTRRGIGPNAIVSAIFRIINDTEIAAGLEPLHPDWALLYQRNRDMVSRLGSPELVQQADAFFTSSSPYDDSVSEINPRDHRITFLLGAGASKPPPSSIPTVKELLPDLLSRARRLDRDDVTRLADFCDANDIQNIEDLLTAAQLSQFCGTNPNVLHLVEFLLFQPTSDRRSSPGLGRQTRRTFTGELGRPPADMASVAFLQDTLQVLFGLLSSRMLPAKPNSGHFAIAEFVKSASTGSSIVTTNYDCCMDLALQKSGEHFSYSIDFMNIASGHSLEERTELIKLHGSLNWFYCQTCQTVQLIDIERTVDEYLADKQAYPVIAICRACGGQRRGLLVPPLAMKFDIAPALNPLLDHAQKAFDTADIVVVVGFSFAEADVYISRMLSKWMGAFPNSKLMIFDPDPSVSDKVRRQFSLRIQDFDPQRVLSVRGDCSQTLPDFLNAKYFRVPEASVSGITSS